MTWIVGALLAVSSAATPLPKIAVLEIRALDAPSTAQNEIVQEVLLADLAKTGQFEVIGASDIAAMLGLERQKQLLGCGDDATSCLAELGGALGAQYVLIGSVARLDQTRRVDLKLLDTSRNKVLARDYAAAESDNLIIERTRSALAQMLTAIPNFKPTQVAQTGPSLPIVPLATVVGGAVAALGGGAWAAWTVGDFNARRGEIRFSEVGGFEARRNIGIGVGVAGLLAVGAGLWLWQQPDRGPLGAVLWMGPMDGGVAAAVQGSF